MAWYLPTHWFLIFLQIAGYAPQNFNLEYDGAVPADGALSKPWNIPAVSLLNQYKYHASMRYWNNAASHVEKIRPISMDWVLIPGGWNNMWELAGVYASYARILNHQQNQGIIHTEDIHPALRVQYTSFKSTGNNINLDATSIYFYFPGHAVMRPGKKAFGNNSVLHKIAWKTGTSFGFRDGWAIGVTPKNVVAVWVGNTDGEGRPGLVGVNTAAPVMFDIFRLLPKR